MECAQAYSSYSDCLPAIDNGDVMVESKREEKGNRWMDRLLDMIVEMNALSPGKLKTLNKKDSMLRDRLKEVKRQNLEDLKLFVLAASPAILSSAVDGDKLRHDLLYHSQALPFHLILQIMSDVLLAPQVPICEICKHRRIKAFNSRQARSTWEEAFQPELPCLNVNVWSDPAVAPLYKLVTTPAVIPLQEGLHQHPIEGEGKAGNQDRRRGKKEEGDIDLWYDDIIKVDDLASAHLCIDCVNEIQCFVSEAFNAKPIYHHINDPVLLKSLQKENVKLAERKARWWAEKGRLLRSMVRLSDVFVKIRKQLLELEKEVHRQEVLAKRNEGPRLKAEARRLERQAIIDRAAVLDAKWSAHDHHSTVAYFTKRRLFCMLQEEKTLGVTLPAPKKRENPKSIKLTGFLEVQGGQEDDNADVIMMPITAERAAEVFGTKEPIHLDYTEDIKEWRQAAKAYESRGESYLKSRRERLAAAAKLDWDQHVATWRAGMERVEDNKRANDRTEALERLQRDTARREKRQAAYQARAEAEKERQRLEALRLAEEARRLHLLALEQAMEANERRRMETAEVEQCRQGDNFYGLIRREKALEEMRLRWEEEDLIKMKGKKKLMKKLQLIRI